MVAGVDGELLGKARGREVGVGQAGVAGEGVVPAGVMVDGHARGGDLVSERHRRALGPGHGTVLDAVAVGVGPHEIERVAVGVVLAAGVAHQGPVGIGVHSGGGMDDGGRPVGGLGEQGDAQIEGPHRRRPNREQVVAADAARIRRVVGVPPGHLGEDGPQMRGLLGRGQKLGDPQIGAAVHADPPAAPGLGGQPLGDLVGVAALGRPEEPLGAAERRPPAPGVGGGQHITVGGHRQHPPPSVHRRGLHCPVGGGPGAGVGARRSAPGDLLGHARPWPRPPVNRGRRRVFPALDGCNRPRCRRGRRPASR